MTDKARHFRDSLKIGDEITVKWIDQEHPTKQKSKVFNVADIYFTTDKGTAIYYEDVISIDKQNELF